MDMSMDGNEIGKTVARVVCPECNKMVRVIPFGEGWVGICCNKVVYNGKTPPDGRFSSSITGSE